MITANERAYLVEKYRDERLYANAVAAKCAVCLALLTGIAVIGATVDTSGDSATARTAGVRNTVEECQRECKMIRKTTVILAQLAALSMIFQAGYVCTSLLHLSVPGN